MMIVKSKKYAALIALILAVVVSLTFLIVDVTALFVVAYVLVLLGIAGFLFGVVWQIDNLKSYPWATAIPVATVQYLVTEVIVSVVIVLLQQLDVFNLPVKWFVVIQAVILAIFTIRIISLRAGKEIIETREAVIQEKVSGWKSLVVDVEAIAKSAPEFAKDLKPVIDAVKYSDPMSNPQLAEYENAIKGSVIRLSRAAQSKEADKVSELCVTLQRQVMDRNNRAKLLK
jgi:hypothetical protein